MLKRDKEVIQWLSFIYTVVSLIYVLYVHNNTLSLVPLLILVVITLIRRLRDMIPLVIYASMFFISVATYEGSYISTPLALSIPFIIVRDNYVEDIRKNPVFGPSAFYVFRYLLISSLLTFVNIRVLIPIALSSYVIVVYALYGYIKLSKTFVEISLVNDTVTWGEKAYAILDLNTPLESYVVLEVGVNRSIYTVKGKARINVELPSDHVGRYSVEIQIYAMDSLCFSNRFIGRYLIEYKVVPLTHRVLEVVGGYLREISDILSFPPTIEITVAQLSEGSPVATESRGREAVKTLAEYIRRAKQRMYFEVIIEEFLKVLEEITEKIGEEGYGYRKTRYGEYIGSRPYVPGDSPKSIHWKKSISKGMLVVKEYSSSVIEESLLNREGEGIEPLLIVDLYAPNVRELDRLVYVFLRSYLKLFKQKPTSKVFLIIVLGDIVVSLRGRSADILHQLYKVFVKTPIKTVFGYTPLYEPQENNIIELLKSSRKPKPLAIFIRSNEKFADNLAKIILGNDFIPPKPFTLIYSSSLNFRYTIVKHMLNRYGFIYMDNIELANLR